MPSITGKILQISVFGESHGKLVGAVIDSPPAGHTLDYKKIDQDMAKRKSKGDTYSTQRKEQDQVEIVTGLKDGKTTGAPLCAIIYNKDIKPKDYTDITKLFRPSHSDYTAFLRYKGNNETQGGGHFSGRLTAPIVFCGSICKQILQKEYGIIFLTHIFSIGEIEDRRFNTKDLTQDLAYALLKDRFPVLDPKAKEKMQSKIQEVKKKGDSLGGRVETAIVGVPSGIGEVIFDGVDSYLASGIFSVPAVKTLEFGDGIDLTKKRGKDANDPYHLKEGKITPAKNSSGGMVGGITTGEPIIFTTGIKPTPSISIPQDTVDIEEMKDKTIHIKGRHDTSIVPRAIAPIEAICAIKLLDMIMYNKARTMYYKEDQTYGRYRQSQS